MSMSPVESRRPHGAADVSRRGLLKVGGGLAVLVGLPFLAQQSITGQDATGLGDATPSASPAASPQASPASAHEAEVGFTLDLRFDPEVLTIAAGTTVTWVNTSSMPHTATGDPEQNPVASSHPEYIALPDGVEPWGSEMLQPGDRFRHAFNTPGEYKYICIPHVLSGMRGTIVVEG